MHSTYSSKFMRIRRSPPPDFLSTVNIPVQRHEHRSNGDSDGFLGLSKGSSGGTFPRPYFLIFLRISFFFHSSCSYISLYICFLFKSHCRLKGGASGVPSTRRVTFWMSFRWSPRTKGVVLPSYIS